jgi:GNAT superfamily N-acetyltransferase
MTVRLLADDDRDRALLARAVTALFDDPPAEPDPAAFLRDPSAFAVAAFDDTDDDVVGLAYGHELRHPDGDRTALLYSLDVADGHRRRGHGRALVTAFVGEAWRRGCSEVWVLTDDANPAAIATYTSAGGARDATPQVMFTWAAPPSGDG